MMRARIIAVCAIVAVIGFAACLWVSPHRASADAKLEIATALLEYHHQFVSNNYSFRGIPLPRTLNSPLASHSSVGTYGASVQYSHRKLGITWCRSFETNYDPQTATWKLYEETWLDRPRIPWSGVSWFSWSEKPLSVTNSR